MAEPEPGALSSAPPPSTPLNKTFADETLTDSEIALTPQGGSSTSSAAAVEAEPAVAGAASSIGSPQISPENTLADTPMLSPTSVSVPQSPQYGAARHPSFSGSSSYQEDWDIPPLDRLTMLDLLDNFALPQQIEKLSKGISAQTRKLKKSRDAIKTRSHEARERMVEEWRHRVPSADEQLDRYRKRMRTSVEKLGRQWNDTKVITMREKVSFICGVLNIFISGYLMGGLPQYMHLWYTVQILYFMPIRFYTYHKRGYHYFLADLCYFVNLLLLLSLWVAPGSKRLFVACYCLAFGNNAVAIIMWRNSLVFHSFDKVTSLFIHVMPCATLHCIVHSLDPAYQRERYPAVYAIKTALPGSDNAYASMLSMLQWSSIPYAFWQLTYYFFITVRRRDKIAAGRPTSFTWLRKSYSKTWIGKTVLALPDALQESAFMLIQYSYAVCTMLPCPIWFAYRWASSAFLMSVFTWSIYNGATFYIDVFGKRFQKELEAMRQEVAKWHAESVHGDSISIGGGSTAVDGGQSKGDGTKAGPVAKPLTGVGDDDDDDHDDDAQCREHDCGHGHKSIDGIPLLDHERADGEEGGPKASAAEAMTTATMTGADLGAKDVARKRI